jgi:rhodanese-related sulfurtransferase
MNYQTITPAEFAARMKETDAPLLIDVREPVEYEIARVEGAQLLPMSRFYEWAGTLDKEREIVVMCHHGIRSAQVCQALAQGGFTKLYNLAGGINRWSREVDPSVPVY